MPRNYGLLPSFGAGIAIGATIGLAAWSMTSGKTQRKIKHHAEDALDSVSHFARKAKNAVSR